MAATAVNHPPSWLDKDFAENSLKGSTTSQDFTIISVDVQRATAPGDNYVSEIYRMSVELQHKTEHSKRSVSLIIKCLPNSEVMKQLAQEMQVFEQEILMFCETIPAMSRILQKAAPGKYTQLSAKCYASGDEPITFVVLEDLKARGFALASRSTGLDLAHARLVVRKLAEFHASSVGLYEQNPAAMDNYKIFRLFEGSSSNSIQSFLTQGCKLLADQLETLEEAYSRYAPKLRVLSDTIFQSLLELVKREWKLRVLTHADSWVNNMMFQYSGGVVKDVVLLDFQISAFSSPAVDLQYFLHTSLMEEVYAEHITDLLKEYHDRLIEVMNDIGVSADKQISFEELLEDLEAHALYAVFAAVAVLPAVRTPDESRFDVEASMTGTATDNNRSAFAGDSYMRMIKQILPNFEKKGIL